MQTNLARREPENEVLLMSSDLYLLDEDQISQLSSAMMATCSRGGVPKADSEDIVQNIWLWFLSANIPGSRLTSAWTTGVTRNFIRRFWRAKLRAELNSQQIRRSDYRRVEPTELIVQIALNETERRLAPIQAELLHYLRHGWEFSVAARAIGIPRGSHARHRKRFLEAIAAAGNRSTPKPPGPVSEEGSPLRRAGSVGPPAVT